MSAATLSAIGFRPRSSPFDSSGGVSKFAAQIRDHLRLFRHDAARSASGQRGFIQPWGALLEQYREVRSLAGDGEYSLPSDAAMREAEVLLGALPSWALPATPLIEPSGSIALEWEVGPNRFLVMAVNGSGKLQHSAILGIGNEYHGSTNFAATIPEAAMVLLRGLLQVR